MSTATALRQIQSVLSAKRDWGAPVPKRDLQRIWRAHDEFIRRRQNDGLQAMRDSYAVPLRALTKVLGDRDLPDPGTGFMAAAARPEVGPVRQPFPPLFNDSCVTVAIPSWQLDTPRTTTSGRSGLATLAASNRSAGTLQVAAACGKYPPLAGISNVPGAEVCAGLGEYNQARASLATAFDLPDHDVALLTVSVGLEVTDLAASGFPYPSDNVLTFAGDRDLGVNGGAAAWLNAAMTLHTPTASVSVGRKAVGGWSADNQYQGNLEAPSGRSIVLSRSVAVQPSTVTIFLAIDLHAVAFAQGFASDPGQAWARIQIDENATVAALSSGYSGFPSNIRVRSVNAVLCQEFL